MLKEDDRSRLVGMLLTARASAISVGGSVAPEPPAFANGQSVLFWWASWFKDCPLGKLPAQYQGTKRPSWYIGEVLNYAGWWRITYAGREYEGHTYDAY